MPNLYTREHKSLNTNHYFIIHVREHRSGNKKGESRETGNIGHTRHRTKINKFKNKIGEMSNRIKLFGQMYLYCR